jgi:hypothetical protein
MTKVQIARYKVEAVTDGRGWECQDEHLLALLNTMASRDVVQHELGYVPDYALAMAQQAIKMIPGVEFVAILEKPPKRKPGVIY